jgi:membrane protease YdiL (CAAX protease family)
MPGPLIGTFILKRFILKEPFGFKTEFFNFSFRKYLMTFGMFLILIAFFLFYVYLFGNLFELHEFGRLNFNLDFIVGTMNLNEIKSLQGDKLTILLPYIIFISALFFISIFSGFINSIFTSAEEIGWRGYLYNEFSALSNFKKNILIGLMWGIWHIPIIIQGLNFSESPVVGSILMTLACISLSFFLSFIRDKSNSIFLVSIFHGMINGVSGFLPSFIEKPNDLFCSLVGLYGIAGTTTLVLIIKLFSLRNKKIFRAF